MAEETTGIQEKTENTAPTGATDVKHIYFEPGGDLWDKPNALCKILFSMGLPSCAVFCNSPSDADLVDAILKKQGIRSKKLIGHVPSLVASEALQECINGTLQALVITDISAEGMGVEQLEAVVNYSIHSDPEVYLHRMGDEGGNIKTVISLVTPIDFGNFHYLKKLVEYDLEKQEIPGDGDMAKARFAALAKDALRTSENLDASFQELASEVLSHDDKEKIIAYLLNNSLTVIPELQQQQDRGRGGDHGRDRDNRDRGERRGRDRDDRRRGRDGYRNDSDNRYDDSRRRSRSETPKKKDIRFYIGHGTEEGFSEESFREILKTNETLSPEQLKRFTSRDLYSFADFAEEQEDQVLAALESTKTGDGKTLIIQKATAIVLPAEKNAEDEDEALMNGSGENGEGKETSPEQVEESTEAPAAKEVKEASDSVVE